MTFIRGMKYELNLKQGFVQENFTKRGKMGCGFDSCIIFFLALFLLQCSVTSSREINKGHLHIMKYDQTSKEKIDPKDPQLQVFFTINDLKIGKKMPIYFPIKDPLSVPPLLSKEKADSIPFSSSQIPHLLEFFSFQENSPQAKAMKSTLKHCEFPAMKGERKFCATSLESLIDSIREILGLNTELKVVTTKHLTKMTSSILQNYTILENPKEIWAPRIIGCHTLPYPYAVYYCHSQVSDNKLFKILLIGENGARIEAAAMCHMDTSQWNRDHAAFLVLKTEPGKSSVCHFFPADNLVWVPSSSGSI
ncbi:hypothetical protein M9H77_19664 [Catharanthus roseus]|uniref:Uncharacterized protein n=1 Tax=Catharanthus roseus TaxID=4058 RepID=A0ACC0BAY6_CATRO|nr:hypothetical protein M9H77_19664 [Catharanthus roseus]